MCDASNIPYDHILDATWEDDNPIPASKLLRPATPTPDGNRTLSRTISCASIDTIRSINKNKGVRRRIDEIAENLKNKDAKKKNKDASSKEASEDAARGRPRIKISRSSKAWKRREKSTAPLQNSSLNPEDDVDLALPDRLYSSVTSAQKTPSTLLVCESAPLVDVPIPDEDEEPWENGLSSKWTRPITFRGREIFQAEVEDVRLNIQPLESDVTIWDGLRAPHHLHKCRLFLQCVTQPYNNVSMPDIRLFEMECSTHPVGASHYARLPVLQSTYQGAAPEWFKSTNGVPTVKLADGIHVDRIWHTILEDDGSWGWYRDAYVPLSPRLFDKMDYREFKLVSRVRIGENCVEGESTFGISMLLREVDMK